MAVRYGTTVNVRLTAAPGLPALSRGVTLSRYVSAATSEPAVFLPSQVVLLTPAVIGPVHSRTFVPDFVRTVNLTVPASEALNVARNGYVEIREKPLVPARALTTGLVISSIDAPAETLVVPDAFEAARKNR